MNLPALQLFPAPAHLCEPASTDDTPRLGWLTLMRRARARGAHVTECQMDDSTQWKWTTADGRDGLAGDEQAAWRALFIAMALVTPGRLIVRSEPYCELVETLANGKQLVRRLRIEIRQLAIDDVRVYSVESQAFKHPALQDLGDVAQYVLRRCTRVGDAVEVALTRIQVKED